jgi:hypothetical protein
MSDERDYDKECKQPYCDSNDNGCCDKSDEEYEKCEDKNGD